MVIGEAAADARRLRVTAEQAVGHDGRRQHCAEVLGDPHQVLARPGEVGTAPGQDDGPLCAGEKPDRLADPGRWQRARGRCRFRSRWVRRRVGWVGREVLREADQDWTALRTCPAGRLLDERRGVRRPLPAKVACPGRRGNGRLVDGLVRQPVAERGVGGQDQQRCAGLGGLDDRGQGVGQPGSLGHGDQSDSLGGAGVGVGGGDGVHLVPQADVAAAVVQECADEGEVAPADQPEERVGSARAKGRGELMLQGLQRPPPPGC